MIKILGYLIIIAIMIFAIFGFLILIEYLRYFKRKIVLRLREKLATVLPHPSEVPEND